MDDVPPLVASMEQEWDGVTIKYFDGLTARVRFSTPTPFGGVIDKKQLMDYAIELWPYLKRCAESGVYNIDMPQKNFVVHFGGDDCGRDD